jgi:hypothetical protein
MPEINKISRCVLRLPRGGSVYSNCETALADAARKQGATETMSVTA